ncbi:L,D-transpeptidase [Oryzibacter oryziterrae]|uniref:L,D-transpeptidase n=1 Tax=Oryzibacter oryziterrae TaxID=2766474 RepID=UPI001F18B512|nr:L,D-transpeptidase [Oryzibacter oryziterrae]
MSRFLALCGFAAIVAFSSHSAFAVSLEATPPPSADELGMRPSISATTPAPQLAMTMAPLSEVASTVAFAGPNSRHALGPRVLVRVDISLQRMLVIVDGKTKYDWPVSTARRGYKTPTGFWTPYRMHVMWHSRKYDNAPMPHSIFFNEGYAIHATPYIKRLGTPASHGCVRLHPDNATLLYSLASEYGKASMRVEVMP